jgi:ribosomal protein S27AE
MASQSIAIICANCNVPMNQHAEKLVYVSDDTYPDPVLGGVIQEMHTCPKCGGSATHSAGSPLK